MWGPTRAFRRPPVRREPRRPICADRPYSIRWCPKRHRRPAAVVEPTRCLYPFAVRTIVLIYSTVLAACVSLTLQIRDGGTIRLEGTNDGENYDFSAEFNDYVVNALIVNGRGEQRGYFRTTSDISLRYNGQVETMGSVVGRCSFDYQEMTAEPGSTDRTEVGTFCGYDINEIRGRM